MTFMFRSVNVPFVIKRACALKLRPSFEMYIIDIKIGTVKSNTNCGYFTAKDLYSHTVS